jgi:penicillin-binding protein 1A
VIADWVAAEVTKILEMNIQSGTGVGANIGRPAGGTTGTTENHADAWFCGITPTLTAAVWVGYPQAEIPMESVHGIAVAGGTFPATIWRLFMEESIGPTPVREFPEAQTEPVWRSFTPGSYGGPPPSSTYYYTPTTTQETTTQAQRTAPPPPAQAEPPPPVAVPPPPPIAPPPPPEPPPSPPPP